MFGGKLFCEINPTCYEIALRKEIIKRHIKNIVLDKNIAKGKDINKLPNLVSFKSSNLIKTGKGIDPILQENKAVNIKLACNRLNGIIIHPGETFSFWKTLGNTTKRKGYREGRVIRGNKMIPGVGGGLCNLGNTIHNLVLLSPLEIVEFHSHSDALAPDNGKRVPFSSGTSVCYNNQDYRFKNNTDQDVQLFLWCEDGKLNGELRSNKEFPKEYRIVEENHHFKKEGEKYYRVSKIYKETIDKQTNEILDKELVLDNHSEVMFDYSQIPQEQIKEEKN